MSIDWRKVNPDELQPQFRRDVEALLRDSPYHWVVTSGHRDIEEQRVLYAKYRAGGPRAAPPGRSAHNYGLAIDVVLDGDAAKPGLQPDWKPDPDDGWAWLKAAIAPHPRLRSGCHFGDWPHIERYQWTKHKPTPRQAA